MRGSASAFTGRTSSRNLMRGADSVSRAWLDGLVDAAFFERMSNQWREEQKRCQREIERNQEADKSYLDEGVALLELARNAQRLFTEQEPREKRRLLNFVLSNCTWADGEVVATFRQPFDVLVQTATAAARVRTDESAKSAKSEIWRGAWIRTKIGVRAPRTQMPMAVLNRRYP
jgi:hypothetical protein